MRAGRRCEPAIVRPDVVIHPDATRVGIAESDVVAFLQGVREPTAPPVGHPLQHRHLHRLVVAVEERAGLRLQDAREGRAARLGGNQLPPGSMAVVPGRTPLTGSLISMTPIWSRDTLAT